MICGIKKIAKLYGRYSVSVSGSKGSGKDMLTANVINARGKPYISNVNYHCDNPRAVHYPLRFESIDCGKNTYKEFIIGNVRPYVFPYEDGTDIYISDAGVYLPSQYNGELNRDYKYLPTFMALSRQLGECYVHVNSQAFARVWDKVREQCDYYIRCRRCIVIHKLVILFGTLYDKAESAQNRVRPCRVHTPLICTGGTRIQSEIARDNYYNTHGDVKDFVCIFRNCTKYDTRIFKEMMKDDKM